jgi:hypothetical protein
MRATSTDAFTIEARFEFICDTAATRFSVNASDPYEKSQKIGLGAPVAGRLGFALQTYWRNLPQFLFFLFSTVTNRTFCYELATQNS